MQHWENSWDWNLSVWWLRKVDWEEKRKRERCLYWTVVVRGDTRVDFEPVHLCKHNVIVRLNLCTLSWWVTFFSQIDFKSPTKLSIEIPFEGMLLWRTLFAVWLRQALCDMVTDVWTQHKDTLCVGIDWELFRDLDHALASFNTLLLQYLAA